MTSLPDMHSRRSELQDRIAAIRTELAELENELQELDDQDQRERTPKDLPMLLSEYRRYGRQMILPGFGLPGALELDALKISAIEQRFAGQLKLRGARILVVGAGGLGCPAMMYLAGAGVGHITIIDDDTVEVSNLHRQVLHAQNRIGMSKVESARIGMLAINPRIQVSAIRARFDRSQLDSERALIGQLSGYTLVLDCTDNAHTRYLLSDACVDAGVTLVSGGAVGLEGWSGVWNLPGNMTNSGASTASARGPCLRCIYPQSNQDTSGNCEDDGVLGTVVGVIGTLMANDAIKLLVGAHDLRPSMTLFSPMSAPMFRNIKLRGRKPGCPGCNIDIKERQRGIDGSADVCGVEEAEGDARISVANLAALLKADSVTPAMIDVRPEVEFGICSLPNSINIPHDRIARDPALLDKALEGQKEAILLCRRGNDSLLDARTLRSASEYVRVVDLRGGLQAWHRYDPSFPLY